MPGTIVVLNGTPRSGKSSLARALQASADAGAGPGVRAPAPWLNLGVDAMARVAPAQLRPGIGLRPGGERPDLEEAVVTLFDALYAAVAAWSRSGLPVVVDVGHHDDFAQPLGILPKVARELRALPAYFVGVRCPVEVVMSRRDASSADYVRSEPNGAIPDIVRRWERAVHDPGIYDLEVDTSTTSPAAGAEAILGRLRAGPPVAFAALAGRR